MVSVQSGRQIREFEHIGEAHPPDSWNLLRKASLPAASWRGAGTLAGLVMSDAATLVVGP
jgi:hypothetical protein